MHGSAGLTGPTAPLNGDLLYRVYHAKGRYLDALSNAWANELYSILASMDADEAHRVVQYDYVPGTALLKSVQHLMSDGITSGVETAPVDVVSYTYENAGGRARVKTETLHMHGLAYTYSYTMYDAPGAEVKDSHNQYAVKETTRTGSDGSVVIWKMDTEGRVTSVRVLQIPVDPSTSWIVDRVVSGNSAGADSARIPCSDGADGRFATADFGRVGRPVVVKDVGNQLVTKQLGRQAARR